MNLKTTMLHRFKRAARTRASQSRGLHKAVRAAELNAAISKLWQAQGTHSKTDFQSHIVPVYAVLLCEMKRHTTTEAAEQGLIDLLNETAAACHHRWTLRLPMKRPGSDYRKYEIIYTYALVTAMAVGCLAALAKAGSPEHVITRIVPQRGIAQLRADPMVWEDWLGYFQQADLGGLYAVSMCATRANKARKRAVRQQPTTPEPPKPSPAGSGRAMLEAIRNALADGSLSFNQPGDAVQVDRAGRTFLEYPAILEWCIDRLALDDDVKRVKNRFDRLKVYKRTREGNQLFRGRLRARDPRSRGYVLEDAALLWSNEAPTGRFVIESVTAKR